MRMQTVTRMWPAAAVWVGSMVGCAANQQKQRLTMLEAANRNLTERLNRAQQQLDATTREREQLNQRLLAALDNVEQLRRELEERPVPESVPAGWTPVPGGAMISIEGNILFAPGQVTLRPGAKRTLDAIVSTIQGKYPDKDILVFGHTDDTPIRKSGWKDNYELSAQRALAVVRYLGSKGIDFKRLIACACGEHRPRVPNRSPAERAQNRRVEIFAVDPL